MKFNKNFIFGVAESDLQTVGELIARKSEHSEETMWMNSCTKRNNSKNESPEIAINRYEKTKEDIAFFKESGIKHYRTSVSMSRFLDRQGNVNKLALNWYLNYFKSIKKAGIKTYVTLYHWELPQYLMEQGGWLNKKMPELFVKYAKLAVEELGEYIDEYFVINEPWCSSFLSYFLGIHPPCEKNLKRALQVAHNLLLTLGLTVKELKSNYKSIKIGSVFNVSPFYAQDSNSSDIQAAQYGDGYHNRWFLDPVYLGKYPEDMMDLFGKELPDFNKSDMETICCGKQMDFVGINYYSGKTVKYNKDKRLLFETIVPEGILVNDLGWPVHIAPFAQEGLKDILSKTYYEYKSFGLKKIYISENGFAMKSSWNGKDKIINDENRIFYIREHLRQVYKAKVLGVPVDGYFLWTLMDNFEWAEGYKPEGAFGLIHIDRRTLKRINKKSFYWYKNIIRTGVLK